jgi:hypothetical protein
MDWKIEVENKSDIRQSRSMLTYLFCIFKEIIIVVGPRIINELTALHDFKIYLVIWEFLVRQNNMDHSEWGKDKCMQSQCVTNNGYYERLSL